MSRKTRNYNIIHIIYTYIYTLVMVIIICKFMQELLEFGCAIELIRVNISYFRVA